MTRKWVVNASPLIILGKISQIDLLHKLAETLVIPKAVAVEIEHGDPNDPAKQWLARDGVKFIVETPPLSTIVANWDLGFGVSPHGVSATSFGAKRNVNGYCWTEPLVLLRASTVSP